MARSTDWTCDGPGSLPPLAALFVTSDCTSGLPVCRP